MEINTKDLVREELNKLKENPRFFEMDKVLQHGSTTVLEHSIKVAYLSLAIVRKYRLKVNYKSLIRGALLHDYFYTIEKIIFMKVFMLLHMGKQQ